MHPSNRIPTHPGEILREEFLVPLRRTQVALAEHLGIPLQRINEIVRGKRGITPTLHGSSLRPKAPHRSSGSICKQPRTSLSSARLARFSVSAERREAPLPNKRLHLTAAVGGVRRSPSAGGRRLLVSRPAVRRGSRVFARPQVSRKPLGCTIKSRVPRIA